MHQYRFSERKIISLNDVVADFDELQGLLLSDVFENISVWDGIKGTDKISREYSGNKAKLLTNLQNDRFDFVIRVGKDDEGLISVKEEGSGC